MTTVLTANIKVTLPRKAAEDSLRFALRVAAPDLVGLQEWGPTRDGILQTLAVRTRLDWTRPGPGVGPTLWDRGRYRLVTSHRHRLARAGVMGRILGRRTTLPDSYASVVVLEDRGTDETTTVVNFHLTAEVQNGAGIYHPDADHRARVRRHKREVRSLTNIASRQLAQGRTVYLVGDTNFDGLKIPGVISCWAGRNGRTLGSRAVDVVYGPERPDRLHVIKTESDHKAVAAVYPEEA